MSFSFGAPSSAPATGGLSTGFNFGGNKPATPGFGLSTTSQPSTGLFGTPASAAPSFGTATPAFGTPSAFGQSTTSGFGTAAAPAFGATSTAPAFGTGTTAAFGATSTAPAFGTTSTSSFGATPAFGATSSALTFGSTTAPAFGAVSAAPAFGTTATPAFGATTSGFGTGLGTGGLNFGAGSNAPASTGLTLGAVTTTSAGLGGLGGFNLSTTSTGLGGGTFGATTTTTSLLGSQLAPTSVTSAQPPNLGGLGTGLGGLAPSGGNTTTSGDGKTEPPKQTKLPNEISTTIDSFKDFVKKQKSLSSEIMRVSIKPLYKVGRDAETMLRAVLSLSGEVGRGRAHSRRLRAAAAAAIAAAEAVANSPATAELESTAPPHYVKELISELEQQLIVFRRQMDVADKQMQSSPKLLTEQELTLGIRRMHESLVALAGRLQAVHSQVEEQKEQYLNLRKYVLKDPSNVFETKNCNTSLDEILWDFEGTRKRSKAHHGSHPASAVLSDPRAILGNLQQLAGPTPFTYVGNTLSQFPNSDTSGNSWQPQSQPMNPLNTSLNTSYAANSGIDTFQLQKPPGKRGKQ